MKNNIDLSILFESEVRRVASELFPRAKTTGPVMLEGRERDGVYNDGEVIHILEATTSRKIETIRYNLSKSVDLVKSLRQQHIDINFKIWIITQNDPTADQHNLIIQAKKQAKCPIEICSFRSFLSKLVNAPAYIQLRDYYPFGSIRKPEDTDDFHVPESEYIPMDLISVSDKSRVDANELSTILAEQPGVYLLTGDFGSGKSMTMRHLYYGLSSRYMSGNSTTFPIYLNLRDHFGQKRPAEALHRHSEDIGFRFPDQLVAAWRSGHCHLFLDGFDELSSSRLVRGIDGLKKARREAMTLVKNFISEHSKDTSIFIAGRQHYFDSDAELQQALGLGIKYRHLTLNEFTQDQVEIYLNRKGFRNKVPGWLPSRPLLLGYLAIKEMLGSGDLDLSKFRREEGWSYILDQVCEREAKQIDPVSIEPHAIREFVDRLASITRKTNSGRGPIYLNDIHNIFQDVFSMPPDEKASTLIFRMPGLTAVSGLEEAREFIDDDYVDACRSGDVTRFVRTPHDPRLLVLGDANIPIGDLGYSISSHHLLNVTEKNLSAALEVAVDICAPCLAMDIVHIMQQLNVNYVGKIVRIRDGFFESFEITPQPSLSNVVFDTCYFGRVEVDVGAIQGPKFEECQIEQIFGCVGEKDVPDYMRGSIDGISMYVDEVQTNSDILDLPLPMATKVLMTMLRKLFVQPGKGRKENAFFRGLDSRGRVYVQEILKILQQFEFATPHKINGPIVWFPNRSRTKEAHAILQSPQGSSHDVARRVREL